MKNKKVRGSVTAFFTDAFFFISGAILYAVSVNCFTAPNMIAMGGLTGVATVLNYLFDSPIGTVIIIVNIPLFIAAIKAFGLKFIYKTAAGTILTSVVIDLFDVFNVPAYEGDRLLAAIFGGVLSGAGLALIFLRGGTTGGSDIIARLLSKKMRHIPMGRMILGIDLFVIFLALFVYKNIESALYAIITIYASSAVIDAILYGFDSGKVLFIVSKKPREVSEMIMSRLVRGVTVLNGRGAYLGGESEVLMCAVRRNEVFRVRDILSETDPSAFIIIGDATEILGEGFKGMN